MENKVIQIKEMILEEIHPKKIYYYKALSLHIFIVIWDVEMNNFQKHVYLRRILRSVDVTFDITTYSSKGFERDIKHNSLTADVVELGKIIYDSNKVENIA